jgi:aquaglyceroporin related protein
MDPIKLVEELQMPLDEEIHNHHTWWSILRTHHREFLAEFLAALVQLTLGFCADLQATLNDTGNPNSTAWAWGFATMIGIYISGGVSGASPPLARIRPESVVQNIPPALTASP